MNLDPVELADHVKDHPYFELPKFLGGKYYLPNFGTVELFGYRVELQVTKLMVVELLVAALMIVLFVPLARKIATGKPPRGRLWNLLEAMVLFVRDEMVRPAIGGKEADRYVPFILTLFFFILLCNLIGLVPWLGSPTGSINVTAALAIIAFLAVVSSGIKSHGLARFVIGLVPQMDISWRMKIFLFPMILAIEMAGLVIRHTILAVRLLANMFAGHLVLTVILGFIAVFAAPAWYGVAPPAVLGGAALSLLELLVAFLQAYIFAFLTALFIGMAIHQH